MFIVGLLRWWYTRGWRRRGALVMEQLDSTMDYFSVGLLVTTMFSLFRQDGAGSVDGSLSVKIHAFFGRLISRLLGAMIRSTVLLIGLVVITVQALGSVVLLGVWAVVPLLPFVGFIITLSGWIPWQF